MPPSAPQRISATAAAAATAETAATAATAPSGEEARPVFRTAWNGYIAAGLGPQDSVQLRYKWLNYGLW